MQDVKFYVHKRLAKKVLKRLSSVGSLFFYFSAHPIKSYRICLLISAIKEDATTSLALEHEMKFWPKTFIKIQPGIILPVLGVCVVLYFAYHAIQGDRGIRALLDYENRVEKTELQLKKIRQERKRLEHRVSLLRSDHLDPDLLEERVRAVLNYALPNEYAIILK
jgi:cell division protein FtsB